MDFQVVIPARYASSRLPGKVLEDIGGKPMVQWVYERAVASGASSVVVATDDQRVADVAEGFGAKVAMTSSDHQSGTDRVIEAIEALEYDDDDIVINVQADEPLIPPTVIRQLAQSLDELDNIRIASLYEPIKEGEQLFTRNVTKVVLNRRHFALYFSRAAIPWDREAFRGKEPSEITLTGQHHYRHIGIYGYRVGFLREYVNWADSPLETVESLEQLRILWHGGRIYMVEVAEHVPPGIDTPEDLVRVRDLLREKV